MEQTEIGPQLEELGRLIAEDIDVDPDGVFMFVEAGDAWAGHALFKDMGDRVLYMEGSDDLEVALMDLWDMSPPDKRWSTMQYDIKDGRFTVIFGYEDVEDPDYDEFERRTELVRARFGDKPIDYSAVED